MKYTVEWTRNLAGFKNMRLHCLDLGSPSGGLVGMKDHNLIDGLSEWNVAPYLNNEALDQRCNATLCNITRSIVVGEQNGLENGMCSGDMVWSYTHQHAGAIKSTMFINGKEYCKNVPTVGTDLNNTPGNEAGFLVRMSECVNHHKYGNKVRLNKGDVVKVESLYDVDPASTAYAPFPGGKRGGIMALFFSIMICDPGTWNERYVCRNHQCIGVGKRKHLDASEPQWSTIEDCSKECGAESPNFLQAPVARYEQPAAIASPAKVSSTAEGIGKLYISTRNCGDGHALTSVKPAGSPTFRAFGSHKIEATFATPKDVTGGELIFKTDAGIAGLTLVDMKTDACSESKKVSTLFGLLSFRWNGASCPLAAGTNATISAQVEISPVIPVIAAETTTTIVWKTPQGETLFCFELETTGKPESDDFVV